MMWRPVWASLLPPCISRQTISDLSGQFNVTFECPHIHSLVIAAMFRPITLSPLNVVPVFGTMHFHQHDVCVLSGHINVLRGQRWGCQQWWGGCSFTSSLSVYSGEETEGSFQHRWKNEGPTIQSHPACL